MTAPRPVLKPDDYYDQLVKPQVPQAPTQQDYYDQIAGPRKSEEDEDFYDRLLIEAPMQRPESLVDVTRALGAFQGVPNILQRPFAEQHPLIDALVLAPIRHVSSAVKFSFEHGAINAGGPAAVNPLVLEQIRQRVTTRLAADPGYQTELDDAARGFALMGSFFPSLGAARLLALPMFAKAAPVLSRTTAAKAATFLAGEFAGGSIYGAVAPLEEGSSRTEQVLGEGAAFAIFGGVFAGGFAGVAAAWRKYIVERLGKKGADRAKQVIADLQTELKAAGTSMDGLPPEAQSHLLAQAYEQVVKELDPKAPPLEALMREAAESPTVAKSDLPDPNGAFEFTEPFIAPARLKSKRPEGFIVGAGTPGKPERLASVSKPPLALPQVASDGSLTITAYRGVAKGRDPLAPGMGGDTFAALDPAVASRFGRVMSAKTMVEVPGDLYKIEYSFKKPMIVDGGFAELGKQLGIEGGTGAAEEAMIAELKKRGYDGLIVRLKHGIEITAFGGSARRVLGKGLASGVKRPPTAKPAKPPEGFEPGATIPSFPYTKVVDEGGKPLRVFHGTYKQFDEIDPAATEVGHLYFSDDPAVASFVSFPGEERGSRVYPAYLDVRNPLDLDNPPRGFREAVIKELKLSETSTLGNVRLANSLAEMMQVGRILGDVGFFEADIRRLAQSFGYDGLTFVDKYGPKQFAKSRTWIAFEKRQVKIVPEEMAPLSRQAPKGFEPTATEVAFSDLSDEMKVTLLTDLAVRDAVERTVLRDVSSPAVRSEAEALARLAHSIAFVETRPLRERGVLPAIRVGGRVFTGEAHINAVEKAARAGVGEELLESAERGYVGPGGKFAPETAEDIARLEKELEREAIAEALTRESPEAERALARGLDLQVEPTSQIKASWVEDATPTPLTAPAMDALETLARMSDDQIEEIGRVLSDAEVAQRNARSGLGLPRTGAVTPEEAQMAIPTFQRRAAERRVAQVPVAAERRTAQRRAAEPTRQSLEREFMQATGGQTPPSSLDELKAELRRISAGEADFARQYAERVRRGLPPEAGAVGGRVLAGIVGGGIYTASFDEELMEAVAHIPGAEPKTVKNVFRWAGSLLLASALYPALKQRLKDTKSLRNFLNSAAPQFMMSRAGDKEVFRQYIESLLFMRNRVHGFEQTYRKTFDESSWRAALVARDEMDVAKGIFPPEFYMLSPEQQRAAVAINQRNIRVGQMLNAMGQRDIFISDYVRSMLPRETFERWTTHGFTLTGPKQRIWKLTDLEAFAKAQNLPGPRLDLPKIQAQFLIDTHRAAAGAGLRKMLEGIGGILPITHTSVVPPGWREIKVLGLRGKMAEESVARALENIASPSSSRSEIVNAADRLKNVWMRNIMLFFWEHGLNALRVAVLATFNPFAAGRVIKRMTTDVDAIMTEGAKHGLNLRHRTDYALQSVKAFERLAQQLDRIPVIGSVKRGGGRAIEKQDRFLWDNIVAGLQTFVYGVEMDKWARRTGYAFLPGSAEYKTAARKAADFANVALGRVPIELSSPKLLRQARLIMFSPQWTSTRVALFMGAAGEMAEVLAGRLDPRHGSYLPFKIRQVLAAVAVTYIGSKILSGKEPEFNPRTNKFYMRTGLRNEAGREQGLDLTGWWQDDLKLFNAPINFFRDRLNPVLKIAGETITGRDFTGRDMTMSQSFENILKSLGPPIEALEFAIREGQGLAPGGVSGPTGGERLQRISGVLATGNVSSLPRPMDRAIARMSERLLRQVGLPRNDYLVFELSRLLRGNILSGQDLIDNRVISFLSHRRRSHGTHEPLAEATSWLYEEGRRVLADL